MIDLYRNYAIGPLVLSGYEAIQVAIVLGIVLVLIAIWTLGIHKRIRTWPMSRGKGLPALDPITNMGQVNYVVALHAAGRMNDQTWEKVVPLIEAFLKENYFPRCGIRIENMEAFGKALRNGRG